MRALVNIAIICLPGFTLSMPAVPTVSSTDVSPFPISPDTIYTLPVVVHVIHTGDSIGSPYNPADSLIEAMIASLNDSWRKADSLSGGVDMQIQFALATRDPDCGPATSIVRMDGTVFDDYLSGGITYTSEPGSVDELLIKGLSRWPNTDYINIWIVNRINGSDTAPGGYAYFPEFNNALTDGIVVLAGVVNGENKTIVHEMGHAFYLYHTYEGSIGMTCAPDTNCTADGDLICDTEPAVFITDCSTDTNVCTGSPFEIADVEFGYTVLNNYMSFTDCQFMFTQGQKVRARDVLCAFRPGLINSGALSPPNDPPIASCMPTASNGLSPYYGIQLVEFGNMSVYSNTSEADGAYYVDRSCNQRVTCTAGDTVFLRVTGSYLNWQQVRVYLDLNGDSIFAASELLIDESGSVVEDSIVLPLFNVAFGQPLRLRVLTDLPAAPAPTACHLTGTAMEGVGQVEDYAVTILRRRVYTLASGDWNMPGIWSCNCVPLDDDIVTVSSGDTVSVPAILDTVICAQLLIDSSGVLLNAGKMFINK
jgi:pregnancy-associated plasma protein-A/GEVED domain-containing protein